MPFHRKGGARRGRRPAHGTPGGPGSSYRQRGSPRSRTSADYRNVHSSDHPNTRASASGGRRYPKYHRVTGNLRTSNAPAARRYQRSLRDVEPGTIYGSASAAGAYDSASREARRTQSRTTRARQQANASRRRKARSRSATKRRRR